MNYFTIDFRITLKTDKKDYAKLFEQITRDTIYFKKILGEDFIQEDNNGNPELKNTDCPYCEKKTNALIFSKQYSKDLKQRILQAQCICCNKDFFAYQENIGDNSTN